MHRASIANGPVASSTTNHSTGRIDPAWVNSYGWQGFSGQNSFLEFGKKPFAPGENGGIHGHVVYASTRPFDDPTLLLQLSWEPMIPHVRINLYQEGFAADGVTPTLILVDHTETSSFDDWAQGFRSDGMPNMNCPGQGTDTSEMPDIYFWNALKDQPQWLDFYTNNGTPTHTLPHDSQFKCYDGMHNWNQLQPAPYDGMYSFPSMTGINPATGQPAGTNCSICLNNPNPSTTNPADPNYDPYRAGKPMLPDGKYIVEVVTAAGLRTGEGRGQEYPHRRQLYRACHTAVRRPGRHLHHARPGGNRETQTTLRIPPPLWAEIPAFPVMRAIPVRSKPSGPASEKSASFLISSVSSLARRK